MKVSRSLFSEIVPSKLHYLTILFRLDSGAAFQIDIDRVKQNGITYEASSESNNGISPGTVVVDKITLRLDNFDGIYDSVDFRNALFSVQANYEWIPEGAMPVPTVDSPIVDFGTYTIEDIKYSDDTLTIVGYAPISDLKKYTLKRDSWKRTVLSDMINSQYLKWNKIYTPTGIDFTESIWESRTDFISDSIKDDRVNQLQALQWIAEMTGYFVVQDFANFNKGTPYPRVKFKRYADVEYSELYGGTFSDYSSGDEVDGGSFNPWNNDYSFDAGMFTEDLRLTRIYSMSGSLMPLKVTGVQIKLSSVAIETAKSRGVSYEEYYRIGDCKGAVINIKDNDFIGTSNVQAVLNHLWEIYKDKEYCPCTVTCDNKVAIEVGDPIEIKTRRGTLVKTYVTRVRHGIDTSSELESAGASTDLQRGKWPDDDEE